MAKINLQKNTGPAPYEAKGFRSGFVILFAVTLAAILLSIALGVSGVALREIKFGTSAKDTNEAFFAADTGAECALINDKSTANVFKNSGAVNINCNGVNNISVIKDINDLWSFYLYNLGNEGRGCAYVTVDKTYLLDQNNIVVTSKGYNNPNCDTSSSTVVERQLEIRY